MAYDTYVVSFEDIQFNGLRYYIERPMMILDRKVMTLRKKVVEFVKVE